jgi:hypothetical protein
MMAHSKPGSGSRAERQLCAHLNRDSDRSESLCKSVWVRGPHSEGAAIN